MLSADPWPYSRTVQTMDSRC